MWGGDPQTSSSIRNFGLMARGLTSPLPFNRPQLGAILTGVFYFNGP